MTNKFPIKILLVDDNPKNLTALEAVLTSPNYTLVKGYSGIQALKLLESDDFAAIILDIQMPEMDGYETAKRIKRLPHAANIPIIFVTAVYKESEDIRKGYEVGAVDFIGKPFDPTVLKSKLHIYVELYRKSRLLVEQERLMSEVEKRRKTEAQLRTILEAVPVGILFTDLQTKTVEMNHEARRIWDIETTRTQLKEFNNWVGWRSGTDVKLGPEDWPLSRAIRSGKLIREDVIDIQSLSGQKRTILVSATPIRDASDAIIGAVAIQQEIIRTKVPLQVSANANKEEGD